VARSNTSRSPERQPTTNAPPIVILKSGCCGKVLCSAAACAAARLPAGTFACSSAVCSARRCRLGFGGRLGRLGGHLDDALDDLEPAAVGLVDVE
jgi:hypothetical protein